MEVGLTKWTGGTGLRPGDGSVAVREAALQRGSNDISLICSASRLPRPTCTSSRRCASYAPPPPSPSSFTTAPLPSRRVALRHCCRRLPLRRRRLPRRLLRRHPYRCCWSPRVRRPRRPRSRPTPRLRGRLFGQRGGLGGWQRSGPRGSAGAPACHCPAAGGCGGGGVAAGIGVGGCGAGDAIAVRSGERVGGGEGRGGLCSFEHSHTPDE